jgi:NAD(P)H-dependent FMN reductase
MSTIALILGSVRRDRQGINVGMWLEQKLKTRDHKVHLIDPLVLELPLLDRMYKEMNPPSEKLKRTSREDCGSGWISGYYPRI